MWLDKQGIGLLIGMILKTGSLVKIVLKTEVRMV